MNYPSKQAARHAEMIRLAKSGDKDAMKLLRFIVPDMLSSEDVPDEVILRRAKLLLDMRIEDATKTLEVEE